MTYGGDERKMVDKINKMEHRDTVEIKEIQERFFWRGCRSWVMKILSYKRERIGGRSKRKIC